MHLLTPRPHPCGHSGSAIARRGFARAGQGGFTLVEALVTLSVLAVLMALAAPSMLSTLSRNQAAAFKGSFTTSIAFARSEAARLGQTVILQTNGGVAGNELRDGWTLYVDQDADGVVSGGDTTLRTYAGAPSNITITGAGTLGFNSRGYLASGSNSTYTVCRVDAEAGTSAASKGYTIIVAASGSAMSRMITGAATC